MAEKFANTGAVALGTLTTAVGNLSSETTLKVSAAALAALQGAGTFRIEIEGPSAGQFEIMRVTAGSNTTTWTVERGFENSTVLSHAIGKSVFHRLTAGALIQAILDYASGTTTVLFDGGNASTNFTNPQTVKIDFGGASVGSFGEFKLRRDTPANWTAAGNPVIGAGELVLNTESGGRIKMGDGSKKYSELADWVNVSLTLSELEQKFLGIETGPLKIKGALPTALNMAPIVTNLSPLEIKWGAVSTSGGSYTEAQSNEKFLKLAAEAVNKGAIFGKPEAGKEIILWSTTNNRLEWAAPPAGGFTPGGTLAAGKVPLGTSPSASEWTSLTQLSNARIKKITLVLAGGTIVAPIEEDIFYVFQKAGKIQLPFLQWPTAGQAEPKLPGQLVFVQNISPGETVEVESNIFVGVMPPPQFQGQTSIQIKGENETLGFMWVGNGWIPISDHRSRAVIEQIAGTKAPFELTAPTATTSDLILKGATGQTAGLISVLPKQANQPILQAKKETGDAFPRYELRADGTMYGGSGTAAPANKLDLGSARAGIVKVEGLEVEGLLGYIKGNFIGFSSGAPVTAGQARDVVIDELTGNVYVYKVTGTAGWYKGGGGVTAPVTVEPPSISAEGLILKNPAGYTGVIETQVEGASTLFERLANGSIRIIPKNSGGPAIYTRVLGKSSDSLEILSEGKIKFGSNTVAPDSTLQRGTREGSIVSAGAIGAEGLPKTKTGVAKVSSTLAKGVFVGVVAGLPPAECEAGQLYKIGDYAVDKETGCLWVNTEESVTGKWISTSQNWTKPGEVSFPTKDKAAAAAGVAASTFPMSTASSSALLPTAGQYQLLKIMIPVKMTLKTLYMIMTKPGSVLTEGQCFAGYVAGENLTRSVISVKASVAGTGAELEELKVEAGAKTAEEEAKLLTQGEEVQLKGGAVFPAETKLVSRTGTTWKVSKAATTTAAAGSVFEGKLIPGVLMAKTKDASGLPSIKLGESWITTSGKETEGAAEMTMKLEAVCKEGLTLEPSGEGAFIHVVLLANGTTMPEFATSGFGANFPGTGTEKAYNKVLNMALTSQSMRLGRYKTAGKTALESLTNSNVEYVKNTAEGKDPFFWIGVA